VRIRYEGRRGVSPLQLISVVGDDSLWFIGQVREYAPDAEINVRTPAGVLAHNAIQYILHAGVEFVDADTGKNPLFTCSDCGAVTTSLRFTDTKTMEAVPYETEDCSPLCITCFCVANPHYLEHHRKNTFDQSLVREAERRINAAEAAANAAVPPIAPAQYYGNDAAVGLGSVTGDAREDHE
jgi:hypothetical protein